MESGHKIPHSPAQIAKLHDEARKDGSVSGPPTCYVMWSICYQLARIADALEKIPIYEDEICVRSRKTGG